MKGYACSFLGLTRANAGTLFGEGFNSKQYMLQRDEAGQAETCNLKQMQRSIVEKSFAFA